MADTNKTHTLSFRLAEDDYQQLAKRCKAACLIPMHHDLYAINGCRENWVREAAADAGVPVRILRCGEHIAFF